ncbi:hypothetical protein [Saccharibacillus sacchari]|uniref:Uncharacterized protein n=1 Tax=Saccharibacillus sacchari TaxID=456493 RepID=A0ACC6PAQ5_9BACL
MSMYEYSFIPADDMDFVPTPEKIERLQTLLEPYSTHFSVKAGGRREFFGSGFMYEGIRCPLCGQEIDEIWWVKELERISEQNGFEDMRILTPCCAHPSSLDKLTYPWPAGFARFSVKLGTDDEPDFDNGPAERLLPEIEQTVGRRMKLIVEKY